MWVLPPLNERTDLYETDLPTPTLCRCQCVPAFSWPDNGHGYLLRLRCDSHGGSAFDVSPSAALAGGNASYRLVLDSSQVEKQEEKALLERCGRSRFSRRVKLSDL
jgi:hypothetical protein